MKNTYKVYSDPGHSWLAVPRRYLEELRIADKISRCSYQSATGRMVYLEEDIDAGVFIEAYAQKVGSKPTLCVVYTNSESRIRKLRHYESVLL